MQLPSYLRPVAQERALVEGGAQGAGASALRESAELGAPLSEKLAYALLNARGGPYAMGAMMRKVLCRELSEIEVRAVVAEMTEGLMVGVSEGGSWL